METKDFFSFGSNLSSAQVSAIELDNEPDETGTKISDCDHNKLVYGRFEGIDFPVIFKQVYRGKFKDILDTGWASLYLISEKLKKVLEDNTINGWKVFPIRLYDLNGSELNGYYGFSIVGHCEQPNYDQSKIIEKRTVPTGPLVQYFLGLSFDGWDSSDFFIPDKTRHIFITKKTAETLKKNKISNLRLENLAEMETNVRHILNRPGQK